MATARPVPAPSGDAKAAPASGSMGAFLGSAVVLFLVLVGAFVTFALLKEPALEPVGSEAVAAAAASRSPATGSPKAVADAPQSAAPAVTAPRRDEPPAVAVGAVADRVARERGVAPAAVDPVPPLATDEESAAALDQAMSLVDAGQPEEAMKVLGEVLKRDPRHEQALLEMAMIQLIDMRQPEQAMGFLKRVVDVNPMNPAAIIEMVSIYQEQEHLDDGARLFLELQQKHPESSELAYGMGEILAMQGKDQEAIPYLQRAAQGPGSAPRAYRDLADAYYRSGDAGHAIEAYGRAIATQEAELAATRGDGPPIPYADEHLAYVKMDKIKALLKRGQGSDVTEAQKLLEDVRSHLPQDARIGDFQASIARLQAQAG